MKNEKNSLDPLKRWLTEVGTDSPRSEFHLSVLKKIETVPQATKVYQPVISSLGWKMILAFVAGIVVCSMAFVPAEPTANSLSNRIPNIDYWTYLQRLPDLPISIPDFSSQFLLGIIAFSILGFILIAGTIRDKQLGT